MDADTSSVDVVEVRALGISVKLLGFKLYSESLLNNAFG